MFQDPIIAAVVLGSYAVACAIGFVFGMLAERRKPRGRRK